MPKQSFDAIADIAFETAALLDVLSGVYRENGDLPRALELKARITGLSAILETACENTARRPEETAHHENAAAGLLLAQLSDTAKTLPAHAARLRGLYTLSPFAPGEDNGTLHDILDHSGRAPDSLCARINRALSDEKSVDARPSRRQPVQAAKAAGLQSSVRPTRAGFPPAPLSGLHRPSTFSNRHLS